MRILPILALGAALLAPATAALADTMSTGGSMAMGSMKMASCPAADPAVILNPKKMLYAPDTPKTRAMMHSMGMSMAGHQFMCKSHAVKMGAKMAPMPSHMSASTSKM